MVFEPLISSTLKLSAEEIETALLKPNQDLAKLHIALLKGIPPIVKNMSDSDAWITVLCKKLASWWPWVAEGENPLKADHGKEIERYKELDPSTRVLILKALCEVRAIQDDFLRYITDEMKKGTTITTFRKEKIGSNGNGITYWYDGNPVIGHRLYKETVNVELKQKPKGKGRATEPTIRYQWQTLATDLEEFREISDSLSSSKTKAEAAVGEMIKAEIIPVLEELEKKKERAWKRQQRQGQQLNGFLSSNGVGITRSRRERRPVCYTFDDYDRSIEEAIEISKKLKTTGSQKENVAQVKHISVQNGATSEGSSSSDTGNSNQDKDHESLLEIKENDEQQSQGDEGDDDYDENDDHDEGNDEDESDHDDDHGASDEEMGDPPRRTYLRNRNQKDKKSKAVGGLRRSQRLVEPSNGRAEMKERPRNTATSSESEGSSSSSEEKQTEMVSDTTETPNASDDELQADSAGDE